MEHYFAQPPSLFRIWLHRDQDNEIARHLTELGQWERKMEREKNVTERYRRMLEESKTPLAIAQVHDRRTKRPPILLTGLLLPWSDSP